MWLVKEGLLFQCFMGLSMAKNFWGYLLGKMLHHGKDRKVGGLLLFSLYMLFLTFYKAQSAFYNHKSHSAMQTHIYSDSERAAIQLVSKLYSQEQ